MAMAVAISPGILILLLYLLAQNTFAQQCLNNVGFKNTAGFPQQVFQKSSCGLNQIAQNGLNYNSPQQGNQQQVNYQQQLTQQASNPPQLNLQQGNSQQPMSSMISPQPLKQQPSQDMAANIFSALYNIKQSAQNQRGTRNIVKGNPSQQNYDLPSSQAQPNPTLTASAPMNKPQNTQSSISNSFSESSQFQPAFTFQFVPINNVPVQPNQQMFAMPVQKASTNDQKQSYSIQSQPVTSSVSSQQATLMQSPIAMMPGTQTNTAQNQPIVLTFQPPQAPIVQNQPTLTSAPSGYSQPMTYTVQTQPSSGLNQNQQISEIPPQKLINNSAMDKQSLMSYAMSQMQNPQGSGNMLASILPAMLNTKSEKSSSMKALLPLIFNLMNEKKNCGGCPHCGCNKSNNNDQPRPEPIINTGYSTHKNYSQKPIEELAKLSEYTDKSIDSLSNVAKKEKLQNVEVNKNSTENSEEDEMETNDSEEEYEEE